MTEKTRQTLWRVGIPFVGVVLVGIFFHSHIALAMLKIGNEFFGGSMPYSLTVADTSYRLALVIDSEVEDAWHQRARIAFLRGDFAGAREMIDKQVEIHGDSFMASYYIRGLIAGYDKRFADAEADFKHFLTWDPTNWAGNNDLAWIYFAQGKFKETAEQARVALLYNNGNPWLHMMYGMALYNLGDKEGALRELLLAKEGAEKLTEADWHKAYPGNDPSVAGEGLAAIKETIENNIALVNK